MYTIGQQVRVIGNNCSHDYEMGQVLTIESISGNYHFVNEGSDFVLPEDIEPYRESLKPNWIIRYLFN